jgi:thiamine-monophosphate kinase
VAEFDVIRRLRQIVSGGEVTGHLVPIIGIGDDAAVLEVPAGQQLVVTTDTLLAGTHFFEDVAPRDLGHKSLAVNLSDLAAMGADPAWFFLALTLPALDNQWLGEFAHGIAELAAASGIILAGGDTTSGPLSVTITAMGLTGQGQAITRTGAREGDLIVVSAPLGDAAFALRQLAAGLKPHTEIRRALDRPEPRLDLGLRLRGLATSCIDVSDGLIADLGHILQASGVGAEISLADLPCSPSLRQLDEQQRFDLQLTGGDDYELCFTLSPGRAAELEQIRSETGLPLAIVGRINGSSQLVCRTPDGEIFLPKGQAYEHFARPENEINR